VAGRLLHGDRLYVDILDNKDPLFFYTDAGALWLFGWKGPFLLDIVWVALAAGSTLLLLRAIGTSWVTAAAGFIAYPLLLTGAWYYSGYSMLAALSLVPLIGWLWIRGSFAVAGVLLGIGLLFKVNMALMLASAPLALVLLRLPAGSARAQLGRAAAGFGGTAAAAAAVLAARGELHGYLQNLVNNVSYSRNVLSATGRVSGIPGHIKVAAGATGKQSIHFLLFVAAFVLAGLLALRELRQAQPASPQQPRSPAGRPLAALFLSATLTTGVTLALTASWSEHDQLLAYPGAMLIVFVVFLVMTRGAVARVPSTAAACVVAALCVALLGGTAASKSSSGGVPASRWFEGSRSESATLLERGAADRFPRLHEITFAHLGQNDQQGAAAFLDGRFVLSCPAIAQYVFSPDLTGLLRCIAEKKPRLMLVTASFRPEGHAPEGWNRFVARGSSLLGASYEPVLSQSTREGLIQVWALRGTKAAARHPAFPPLPRAGVRG
jgi:hypothetical protein